MFGGGFQVSKEQERLDEIKATLADDRAKKDWENVLDAIYNLISDVRGQIEASAFCTEYLKELIPLAKTIADKHRIPTELAHILAFNVHSMFTTVVNERYEAITKDTEFMDRLTEVYINKPALTKEEIDQLEAEKATLEVTVSQQKEEDDQEDEDEDDEDEQDFKELKGDDKFGTLDPKNPFGLN